MTDNAARSALDRLRGAGMRLTVPRIGILQVFADARDGELLPAEEVFRRLCLRGLRVSLGTVYRSLQQMQERAVLQSFCLNGNKRLYRLKTGEPCAASAAPVWVVNRDSGERVGLPDEELLARLLAAAHGCGLDLSGGRIAVEFDCVR